MTTRKRVVEIRGERTTFSSRILKSGEAAFYRGGRRVKSPYQVRLAKGILQGKTPEEARGRPFGAFSGKVLSKREIEDQEEFHLEKWAEPAHGGKRGEIRKNYYMKVRVTSESVNDQNRPGSPTGREEACVPVTLLMRNPFRNDQDGFTHTEIARNFVLIAQFTLKHYRLELCNDDLAEDLIAIWRHN